MRGSACFLASVDRAIQHAREWPHTGALIDGLPPGLVVRRSPVPLFPYYVAFLVSDEVLRVLAVAHDHRRSGYWKSRTRPGAV